MLTLIEGCQTWLKTVAVRPDLERYTQIQRVLEAAHAKLHHRMEHLAASRHQHHGEGIGV